eukprot:TRINITY_DN5788_c0_g1_i1.p1 TRINITY_DN5788_c0_g1~~TRINITY_DN5788_c0_g1_i1.p1  ORF type:complete len:140 (-),score=15.90 TRINITY_DN5788_c0_g1_i1:84-503(-)
MYMIYMIHIVTELDISKAKLYTKTSFSMYPVIKPELVGKETAVLFGAEAHVCVLQTALDLLENGISVHLLVDGTSSQRQFDRMTAFSRLREAGVLLTTTESVLFQIIGDATHPNFKAVSNLAKQYAESGIDPQLSLNNL